VGQPIGTAIFLGIVASILSLPILLLAREFALYSARTPLPPERAGKVADWLTAVAREAGAEKPTILYVYRKGVAMRLVQFGEPILVAGEKEGGDRRRVEFSIAALVHRASWNGLAAASILRGRLIVAIPARTMNVLEPLAEMGRRGIRLRVETPSQLRTVYRIVKELTSALHTPESRLLAAYMATKLIAKLLLNGSLVVSGKALEEMDKLIPSEPPWIRRKVLKQLNEETIYTIQP
jgi:hypothetical protein